ncbi:MAG: hypothetical protein IKW90_08680 [Lachnospiraceae bacterium]|nr:hypothetical protein [Lachnospiraceae bacterium]
MKKITIAAWVLMITLSLTACRGKSDVRTEPTGQNVSDEQDSSQNVSEEKNETESDCYNNGRMTIMETEYGYYFNLGFYDMPTTGIHPNVNTAYSNNSMSLTFHDKESGVNVLLCNKPECVHSGDENCVATYKNILVINTVMYDGSLYIYGTESDEKKTSFNLYRAALDGSSIDKVGTVFEGNKEIAAENIDPNNPGTVFTSPSSAPQYYYFIIHKGYAYLPYFYQIGAASKGYQGGGLKRMDLKTGAIEDVYTVPMKNSAFPLRLYGSKDKVYMYFEGLGAYYGWQYYDINTKEISHTEWDIAFAEKYEKKLKKMETYYEPNVENDRYGFDILLFYPDEEHQEEEDRLFRIIAHEKYNFENDKSFDIDIKNNELGTGLYVGNRLIAKDDMLIICGDKKLLIYGTGDDNWGQKLGEFTYESGREQNEAKDYFERAEMYNEEFKMDNGKIYKIVSEGRTRNTYYNIHSFYCCPIEKVLKGEGSWEFVFDNKWSETD